LRRITGALAALLILLGTATGISPEPEIVRPQLVREVSRGDDRVYLGVVEVTAYTAGYESTGKRPGDHGYRITKSGAEVKEGRTCAAVGLPFGTKLYIEGVGVRVVEDTGGLVPGQVDIFMEDVDRALEWGRQKRKAWVIKV